MELLESKRTIQIDNNEYDLICESIYSRLHNRFNIYLEGVKDKAELNKTVNPYQFVDKYYAHADGLKSLFDLLNQMNPLLANKHHQVSQDKYAFYDNRNSANVVVAVEPQN